MTSSRLWGARAGNKAHHRDAAHWAGAVTRQTVAVLRVAWRLVRIALGHGLVFAAAPWVESRSDVLIDPWHIEKWEFLLLPLILGLGLIVGLLPGLSAYRVDVARGLQS